MYRRNKPATMLYCPQCWADSLGSNTSAVSLVVLAVSQYVQQPINPSKLGCELALQVGVGEGPGRSRCAQF